MIDDDKAKLIKNFDFQYFVVLLLKGINEKNESYLCQEINETLKQKGIENKEIDKINYTMKGVKAYNLVFYLLNY